MEKLASGTLKGGMQDFSLTVDRVISHAARWHGNREVVSYYDDGSEDRLTYHEIREAAARLSNALLEMGVKKGDRVATLAMNSGRHLVAWYAISGIGAVCHTLNPRFSIDQLEWIANHASDRFLFADGAFFGLAEELRNRCSSIEKTVYFTCPSVQNSSDVQLYQDLISDHESECVWGDFEEESAAGLCYTSGTSGDPKGVLYSHRSNVLHTLMTTQSDVLDIGVNDVIMPIVPMFHANAWGLAFSAPAVGARLIMPGGQLDGKTLYHRLKQERVTFSAGVPTVWLGLLDHMEATNSRLPDLKTIVVGGAALPEHLLRRFSKLGCRVLAAWGMTELSPVGGVVAPVPEFEEMSEEEKIPYQLKQGRPFFGIDMRIVGEDGTQQKHDGIANGELQMSGPTVCQKYFALNSKSATEDNFLKTGDIATIDSFGFVKITDRAKDVIKSGGEWISSIEIENAACTFPGVSMAAALGIPHPKWDERPLLLITVSGAVTISLEELAKHLASRLPKWWLPEEIRVVDQIPLGATGKVDKKVLRDTI